MSQPDLNLWGDTRSDVVCPWGRGTGREGHTGALTRDAPHPLTPSRCTRACFFKASMLHFREDRSEKTARTYLRPWDKGGNLRPSCLGGPIPGPPRELGQDNLSLHKASHFYTPAKKGHNIFGRTIYFSSGLSMCFSTATVVFLCWL